MRTLLLTAVIAAATAALPHAAAQDTPPPAANASLLEAHFTELQAQAEAGDLHACQQLYLRYAVEGRTDDARRWAGRYNELLTKQADSGDTRAMLALGARYYTGADYTPQDTAQAATWFSRAAEAGEASGAYMLGEVFAKQGNTPSSRQAYAHAYELYTKRGDADPEALYWQGFMEQNGIGTPRQPESGIAKLNRATELGSAWAAAQLFKTYMLGIGTPQDEAQALRFARSLADTKGEGTMAYVVATAYLTGRGVTPDAALGEHYLDLAVRACVPDAIYMKANRLEAAGKLAEAIPYYNQAASMQQTEALVRMGVLLLHGSGELQADQARGLAMLEIAGSRFGSPHAAWELAQYYTSIGEPELADSWYATAAERGVPQAMARRGLLHLIPGSNYSWSPTETIRWWRIGKQAQDPTCRLYLNLFYYAFIPLILLLVFGLPVYMGRRLRRRAQ